ncbi:MAG TPA: prephenate dehydrogenase/arogenate dehydrogenase family protein, partial [Acidimicrobiales bacterium]|nr:prephenate dehydrogenase/arogenate dehydrogenase family protein [Acidimicrobiales bacterium]
MTSRGSGASRRAAVVGTGLIGGSLGLALRERGWHVTGRDRDDERAARAVELGALDAVGDDPDAELTFVATPVGAVAGEAAAALKAGGVVTDVGSVKASIVEAVGDPRFVGGHPMAGSEQEGVEGADPQLFSGAVWVLTPTPGTDPAAHVLVRSVVSSLGAEVVELTPDRHDALVAVVSHVPHLAAAALMGLAAERAEEHEALLRLAAGGFRDMTRIAAGHPGIWPDICVENRSAISDVLGRLEQALASVRALVEGEDRAGLLAELEAARAARANLPGRAADPTRLAEVRVPVPDRPGVLAEVTTLASELQVDIADLEIAHSSEGDAGVLILTVDDERVER